jgi:hypothetical protein
MLHLMLISMVSSMEKGRVCWRIGMMEKMTMEMGVEVPVVIEVAGEQETLGIGFP